MATKTTKFSVGIFVIAGLFISVSIILYFGFSGYFKGGEFYAAYFDESVQGLDKDSPVKYRGVTVGRVDSINVAPDDTLIEVILKTEEDIRLDRNIVAQLRPVGITGIMFVELDRIDQKESFLPLELAFEPDHPVIQTRSSDLKRTLDTVENILDKFNSLDVKGISDRAVLTLDNVNTAFENLERILDPEQWNILMEAVKTSGKSLDILIGGMNQAVTGVGGTVERVDRIVRENEEDLARAIRKFTSSMEEASLLMSQGSDLVDRTDQAVEGIQRRIMVTLQNLEKASRNLNLSMEQVADRPSSLFFNRPAPER